MKHVTKHMDDERVLARDEAPIQARDLLQEILPLMQDYFVGDITLEKDGILYRLPNGQNFLISVKA